VNAANNPPASRNQGILYIDVSVAPVRPAEFVVIRIQQSALPNG
jgi:phage tail sheath protein FI